MKKFTVLALAAVLATGCNKGDAPAKLDTQEQKVNYIVGLDVGGNIFKSNEIKMDDPAFIAGVKDAIAGKQPQLTEEEIKTVMTAFSEQAQKRMEAKQAEMKVENEKKAKENAKAEKEFLEKNGKRAEVKTTKSGLQYEVISEGSGPKPKATDVVTVHYSGKLLDGTEFDSSYKRNEPVSFPLNGVIPGWTEGLQLMPVGSKFKLYIPSKLAYGAGGQGPIGPNAMLIFDVELLQIGAPQAKEQKAKQANPEQK